MTRPVRAATCAAAALAAALVLGACSVELVDDDADAPPAATAPTTSPTPTPTTPSGPDEPVDRDTAPTPGDPAAPDQPDEDRLPTRGDLRATVRSTTTCDPAGTVVAQAGAAVEVSGACTTLTVLGAGAVVVAEDVDALVVSGAGARVAVRSAASVRIDAADVTVSWETGTPRVDALTSDGRHGAVVDPQNP